VALVVEPLTLGCPDLMAHGLVSWEIRIAPLAPLGAVIAEGQQQQQQHMGCVVQIKMNHIPYTTFIYGGVK
jgi:hypothetical protein